MTAEEAAENIYKDEYTDQGFSAMSEKNWKQGFIRGALWKNEELLKEIIGEIEKSKINLEKFTGEDNRLGNWFNHGIDKVLDLLTQKLKEDK